MRFMLLTELEAARGPVTEIHGLGWQTEAQWQALQENLLAYQAIAQRIDVQAVFTNRFLPDAD
jgi:hypothetical protein